MKKIITLILCLNFSILLCQENFWNDVLLEVPSPETSNVVKLIDGFYSKIDFPEGVGLSVSRIAYKGENMRATHILSFLSKSSQSLSDFLNSLTGPSWDSYIKEMRKYIVDGTRRSAGTSFLVFNEDQIQPIGQVWTFKVKDFDSFTSSCAKLMNTINLDGFVAIGQIVHGVSDGENAYIYGTYPDLNSAFITGPKNELEQKAFKTFSSEMSDSEAEYNQSFTRVLLKSYP
jgi:hypothetical protein